MVLVVWMYECEYASTSAVHAAAAFALPELQTAQNFFVVLSM